ncbi:helix-turn-helix transcriptional regulator [Caulobacter endophyticus]|uniref:helix-turn-helix transcriptional regulator n=1 Tax=Caulobacter endophyticus TaxID=2172652 RepID=UPI002410A6CC|nr:AraC family transcriptional regulator [Caulobacter endophyticus]MDG2529404.1 AraC family transcriptional regulator [Caulobacter endophyticus]
MERQIVREQASARVGALLEEIQQRLLSDVEGARRLLDQAILVLQAPPLAEAARSGGLAPWQARRVASYIDDNLERGLTVAELAAAAGVRSGYFGKAFKSSFGVSPHAMVVQRRVARAKILIAQGEDPLKDIALACGFSDQSHLTNRFHRLVGMTPNAWRRLHAGALEFGDRDDDHGGSVQLPRRAQA